MTPRNCRSFLPQQPQNFIACDLQPALEEAVRLQLVSDVPVGVFLSGGIDSSALVSILSRGGVTPSTFSIVFREADFSEAQHSRAVAAKFRTDHHEINVSQSDVFAAIPDALRCDGPAHDGRHQHLFRLSRDPSSGRKGCSFRPRRRRSLCRIFLVPHRPTDGALFAHVESPAPQRSRHPRLSLPLRLPLRPTRIASSPPWRVTMDASSIPTSSPACYLRPISATRCFGHQDAAASETASASQRAIGFCDLVLSTP